MFDLFIQTLGVTAPVFAMMFLGLLLRRLEWIDTAFVSTASSLVFRGTMPTLLFLSILRADLSMALAPALLGYFCLASVASFLLAWGWALWRCPRADRGVYVQGAFRGNNGIIGLALAASLYGEIGLSLGSVLAGVAILCYNVLASVILALYSPAASSDVRSILRSIVRNPLIIGIVLAIPFAYWRIPLPEWLLESGDYFAQMTLPLALICIGATLSLRGLRDSGRVALSCSLLKMFGLPLPLTLVAWWLGFRGAELGILFLYFACPTAAASFVMAKAVGSNHQLAAAVIAITTLMAVVNSNLGLFILQWGGWI
ncbi:AEC family transporter [Stutzerimonas kirkiae]|uniref:AEC family transporter n=1 Tax=Stutzerimonas kirkiae TaxID=2211392 RepID=UPI0010383126|nr:AEC family transporter [Stutzerimonas kirkiae]TBV11107.1 AEC family transporter [Stutzerimonas kirkiae]